jgi:hypothetical protein
MNTMFVCLSFYYEKRNLVKYITEGYFVKHINLLTIYNDYN